MSKLREIDKDFYCTANCYCHGRCLLENMDGTDSCGRDFTRCRHCHRKFPTPAQFKEEYGFDYPDDGAVYVNGYTEGQWTDWNVEVWKYTKMNEGYLRGDQKQVVICACTPFGKPANDWRPE